jgi:hypothetical protein
VRNTKTDIEWLEARIALRDRRMAEALARLEQWSKSLLVSPDPLTMRDLRKILTVEAWEDARVLDDDAARWMDWLRERYAHPMSDERKSELKWVADLFGAWSCRDALEETQSNENDNTDTR